ncbi:MAG: sodium ion-translocating decarboxylase subunit beta [Gammaproteobacteria bacterium]|nr:sodium ion-translocating decarboxylase subunit beta [Gammaproteobacteria bacterium]
MDNLIRLWEGSGLYNLSIGQAFMIAVGLILLFLAIRKKFEPLLLLPIGFGAILSNIPMAGLSESASMQALDKAMLYESERVELYFERHQSETNKTAFSEINFSELPIDFQNGHNPKTAELARNIRQIMGDTLEQCENGALCKEAYYDIKENESKKAYELSELAHKNSFSDGILYLFYFVGLASGVFPLLIFMGVGAMTDFGPLLANPKTLLLGAAAQVGIFMTLLGAIALGFTGGESAAIAIIGGADGPTAIYVTTKLAPHLLGAIAVAAYSYMALVPLIQPPIMRFLTTEEERKRTMTQLRPVSQTEKIIFPILLVMLVGLVLPEAAPLLGMFCFGTLMRESGVVDRLSQTTQNSLINIVTIFLGLAVGSKLQAGQFLHIDTIKILLLGVVAFSIGTACGVLMAKLMHKLTKENINPLIGSAGVSAVPMAARVSNKVGLEANPKNFLLMHAMGPNVAGVIGSAMAAGVLLKYFGS